METTQLAVIGLGGVGGYFGCKLAQTYAADPAISVAFVARGYTYQLVAEKGLTLYSPEHPDPVGRPALLVDTVDKLPPTDVFLICVKEYDLESVCQSLKKHIHPQTVLLPLMNGVDIYERIRKIIPEGIVLPTCVYVASHLREKGIVEHKGKSGKIIMGNDPQRLEYSPEFVFALLQRAGINIEYPTDAFPAIWTKFLFIASFGLVSACFNKPIGKILEDPSLQHWAKAIMDEIWMISRGKNVELPDDIIEQTFRKAATFPYDTPTSLQLDIQGGKAANELELFAGTIIRYGKELGIPVRATEEIYQQINEKVRLQL